jgi:hypothetical protein
MGLLLEIRKWYYIFSSEHVGVLFAGEENVLVDLLVAHYLLA